MKRLFHNPVFRLAIAVVMFAITPACSKRDGAGGKDSNVDYWADTMHASVHAKDPGKCAICSMDLEPVTKDSATPVRSTKNPPQHDHAAMLAGKPSDDSANSSPSDDFVVPVERQQQIGVSFATVEMKPLSHSIRAVGRVVPDTH